MERFGVSPQVKSALGLPSEDPKRNAGDEKCLGRPIETEGFLQALIFWPCPQPTFHG